MYEESNILNRNTISFNSRVPIQCIDLGRVYEYLGKTQEGTTGFDFSEKAVVTGYIESSRKLIGYWAAVSMTPILLQAAEHLKTYGKVRSLKENALEIEVLDALSRLTLESRGMLLFEPYKALVLPTERLFKMILNTQKNKTF